MRALRCLGAIASRALLVLPLLTLPALAQEVGHPEAGHDPRRGVESDEAKRDIDRRREDRRDNVARDAAGRHDVVLRENSEFHDAKTLSAEIRSDESRVPRDAESKTEYTLKRIENGQTDPHLNDGAVFENREGRLPKKELGYYKEYVYRDPANSSSPGEERIVIGRGGDVYYTPDHYKSFSKMKEAKGDSSQ